VGVEIVSVPAIAGLVFGIIEAYKKLVASRFKAQEAALHKIIPIICVVLGACIGLRAFFLKPEIVPGDSWVVALLVGGASGWAATGADQSLKLKGFLAG